MNEHTLLDSYLLMASGHRQLQATCKSAALEIGLCMCKRIGSRLSSIVHANRKEKLCRPCHLINGHINSCRLLSRNVLHPRPASDDLATGSQMLTAHVNDHTADMQSWAMQMMTM